MAGMTRACRPWPAYVDAVLQRNPSAISAGASGNGDSIAPGKFFQERYLSQSINELNPEVFSVEPNYPNPFNPVTTLRYELPENALVNITIYDIMGRQVSTLVSSQQTAGYKSVQWYATNDEGAPVSAGLYLYTIEAGQYLQTKKMVLLK